MENPIKMGWFGGKTHYFRKHPCKTGFRAYKTSQGVTRFVSIERVLFGGVLPPRAAFCLQMTKEEWWRLKHWRFISIEVWVYYFRAWIVLFTTFLLYRFRLLHWWSLSKLFWYQKEGTNEIHSKKISNECFQLYSLKSIVSFIGWSSRILPVKLPWW